MKTGMIFGLVDRDACEDKGQCDVVNARVIGGWKASQDCFSLRHDDDLPCGEVNQSERPRDVGCRESSVPASLELPVHKDIGGLSSCIPVRSAHSTDRRVDAVLQIECRFSMSSQSPFSCVVVSLRINGSTNDFKVLR